MPFDEYGVFRCDKRCPLHNGTDCEANARNIVDGCMLHKYHPDHLIKYAMWYKTLFKV